MSTCFQGVPVSGRWIWKEDSFNPCLEFVSNNPTLDKQDRRRKVKEDVKGRGERTSAGVPRVGGGGAGGHKFPTFSLGSREQSQHTTVTLSHIKNVSLEILSEQHHIPVHFEMLYRKERFDDFLLHLLHYFNCYFNKSNMDNKRHLIYIEPCKGEKIEYAHVCDRLKHAQKLLGGAYSLLLLGLEVEEQHHMSCGRSKVSRTNTDRSLFETLYQFCIVFVWITFYRKHLVQVRQEVGRLLRSDTFNPALHVKAEIAETSEIELPKTPDKEEVGREQKCHQPEQKSTTRENKRHYLKRPAIKSIVNQRSPAIVSILPSPKEEALWLFRRPHEKTERSSFYALRDAEAGDYTENSFLDQMLDVSNFKVGILGEPYRQFNPLTLTPVGAETEGEGHAGDNGEKSRLSDDEDNESEANKQPDAALSRQATAVSRATTEVAFTDDES